MTTRSLQKCHEKKDMGYAKRNKGHAQEGMKRKTKNWTHDGPRKKEKKTRERKNDRTYPRKNNKGEMAHEKEFIHPSTIPTHMHILIKVYDLFLPWIRFLT
jgi:hypothetical protein